MNLSVSTKLTMLVLVLPISVLTLSEIAIFSYHQTIDVSASISTIAVLLLVWERLRDSLSKKLEYLHKNHLLSLYLELKKNLFSMWETTVERANNDLKRYGKFMIFPLYPKDLLKRIDRFLVLHKEFHNSLGEMINIGYKRCDMNLDRALWLHLVHIKNLREDQLQNYANKPIFQLYAKAARKVEKEQAELIRETKNQLEQGEKMRKEISKKLEHFLRSNNLTLEREPVRISTW